MCFQNAIEHFKCITVSATASASFKTFEKYSRCSASRYQNAAVGLVHTKSGFSRSHYMFTAMLKVLNVCTNNKRNGRSAVDYTDCMWECQCLFIFVLVT